MASVLIIDDDRSVSSLLKELVGRMGHRAVCRHTLDEGLQAVSTEDYDVVLLDVQMPDGNGLEVLPVIRKTESPPEVVIMTGYSSSDGAEIAIRNGAWDYIQKSDSTSKIKLLLQRVLQYRESLKKTRPPTLALKLDEIVGHSVAMKACYDLVAQAATMESNVLLNGETGTGKELFAGAIHDNSSRAEGNFVVVDCAALPENLVGSVLFGHVRGAFTGADQARQGLVEQAHRGTLFLDEIGELPMNIQKVFLRVLQEHRYRPLGGKREEESDFRLITATNRDLEAMAKAGKFREDLLFRLRTLCITLPPLRDRLEDIKLLANHYIVKICERQKIGVKGTSPDFLEKLSHYSWPGNVRELINTVETAISSAQWENILFSRHLPEYVRIRIIRSSLDADASEAVSGEDTSDGLVALPSFKAYRKNAADLAEKEYLEKLMVASVGKVQAACRISGLSRSRFYELMKRHGMPLS